MPRKKKAVLSNGNGNGDNGNHKNGHELPKCIDDPKYIIRPKNEEQRAFLEAIHNNIITFGDGPAGCGKSLLSVSYGLNALLKGKYERIVISRPAIEAAGEALGWLPGTYSEKLSVYLTPIFEAFSRVAPEEVLSQLYKRNGNPGLVRIMPLAYMRGISLVNTFTIVDEAQNLNIDQARLLITRIGEGSKIVIVGDTNQSDLRGENGLSDAFALLQGIEGIGFVTLTENAIVRHPIIAEIERRYQERKKKAIADKQKKVK